ncbi:MAG: polysaccharide deacetylase family protein [Candidatus Krumholzibacteriota bacterium]|nr:polysaccharide deacetylase family protein [Candidatus Krumholzibacteriota bacterium]
MGNKGVPVIMYHGVSPGHPGWLWNHLLTPVEVFEAQMSRLREGEWTAISLAQLYSHMSRNAPLPEKPIVLTFDDGYLDNWVYAYPILKKYGLQGVIWMTTDFIDPRPDARPNLDDYWNGRVARGELRGEGFLSLAEMRKMVSSGHIEIQSHARTHTWYFRGPRIVDFHRPKGVDGYIPQPWLAWNAAPQRKFAYLAEEYETLVPYGSPIYENGKSLQVKRYFEDEELTRLLVDHVRREGGERFFLRPGWRKELERLVAENPPRGGRLESEEEYRRRVEDELQESRRILSSSLGTEVNFLCWPGAGINDTALRLASEAGYLATTTHYLDRKKRNCFGENPREINRIYCGSPWFWRGKRITDHTDPGFFLSTVEAFRGNRLAAWKTRLFKFKYLVHYYLLGSKNEIGVR